MPPGAYTSMSHDSIMLLYRYQSDQSLFPSRRRGRTAGRLCHVLIGPKSTRTRFENDSATAGINDVACDTWVHIHNPDLRLEFT